MLPPVIRKCARLIDFPQLVFNSVREGFEPSVPFWGTEL